MERVASTLNVAGDVGYTCETAAYFFQSCVYARWESFISCATKRRREGPPVVQLLFPFADYFSDVQPLFRGRNFDADVAIAKECFCHLRHIFTALDECRAFELLRSSYDRGNFLLTKHAKVIAMTCTHAAIKRSDLVALGFQYDNLVLEEAAQILEVHEPPARLLYLS